MEVRITGWKTGRPEHAFDSANGRPIVEAVPASSNSLVEKFYLTRHTTIGARFRIVEKTRTKRCSEPGERNR